MKLSITSTNNEKNECKHIDDPVISQINEEGSFSKWIFNLKISSQLSQFCNFCAFEMPTAPHQFQSPLFCHCEGGKKKMCKKCNYPTTNNHAYCFECFTKWKQNKQTMNQYYDQQFVDKQLDTVLSYEEIMKQHWRKVYQERGYSEKQIFWLELEKEISELDDISAISFDNNEDLDYNKPQHAHSAIKKRKIK